MIRCPELEALLLSWGGVSGKARGGNGSGRERFAISWHFRHAVDFLTSVQPLLIVKRRQAVLAIELGNLRAAHRWNGKTPRDEAYFNRQTVIAQQISDLNKGR